MLDRESTFADAEIVKLLKTKFVPVAIDQKNQRKQKDAEGEFYRKIAGQSPRNNFNSTTQGFYIATPAGKLLLYNNNRNPERVRRLMREKLAEYRPEKTAALVDGESDKRFDFKPPRGGLIVRVRAKVLAGYEPTTDRWRTIFQNAMSRDNLWISREEHLALVAGDIPKSLQRRLAKFHLVDNTRGEPPMWNDDEIRSINMKLSDGVITGSASLRTAKGDRSYDVEFRGVIETKNKQIVRFDMVALGDFFGQGRYTGNAPEGKFPLGISFSLADGSDTADSVPPQGTAGWERGYWQ
ncbi:MAG: hypothetical protein NXI22_03830 [bacterium]|nr:hypothetical protein [bacterium]